MLRAAQRKSGIGGGGGVGERVKGIEREKGIGDIKPVY